MTDLPVTTSPLVEEIVSGSDVVPKMLDLLAQKRAEIQAAQNYHADFLSSLLSPAQLDALVQHNLDHAAVIDELTHWATRLEDAIRAGTRQEGKTLRGNSLMAVFMSGRTTWDDKFLKGYAAAHPEILVARKQGEPSVQIRENKANKEES